MKVVLSRKGFDSGSGWMPNPIMPDGTLLSLPIPAKEGKTTYKDLYYNGKSYYEIIEELNANVTKKLAKYNYRCHVDPDLCNRYYNEIHNWQPAFGQHGMSQAHLKNQGIKEKDIFLFYGWFRKTYEKDGKLKFVTRKEDKTIDKHVIYGYMQIGEIISDTKRIREEFAYHPHAHQNYSVNNTLYLPTNELTLETSKKGVGILKYTSARQLTMEGHCRGEWELPMFLKDAKITFHEKSPYGWQQENTYFKSASRGQEFVISMKSEDELIRWILEVLD